ncbi:hypothetical protein R3P38DRAFT_2820864 [Favolaschia claudopus]|uniref:MIT domain-containing protein n=1 Tax=Favolaschia claudopus TaxID=2862362 RepID=A0AAW0EI50_9AGAR
MTTIPPIPSETTRQTLTRALAAANIAVKLDEANQDTTAIVDAYQRSILLLDEVISRHDVSEELERLAAVRTTYRHRIEVLLLSRTVPITQQQSTETLIGTAESASKSWKFPKCTETAKKARRWTKLLCGCTRDGSIMI